MLESRKTGKNEKSETTPIIKIHNLIKIYKSGEVETSALRGLIAEFYPGEISVIMGPSGCGKTTLLNVLGGIISFDAGDVFVDSVDIANLTEKELDDYHLNKVGYIFQFFNLIPELTVEQNIALQLELRKTDKEEIANKVDKVLEFVGLQEKKNSYPNELSGGEQQRIAIAAGITGGQRILLCDEPTGELDSKSKRTVMKLFQDILSKYPDKCILIVSHDQEMKNIADRFFHIKDGQIAYVKEIDKDAQRKQYQELLTSDFHEYAKKQTEEQLEEAIYNLQQQLTKLQK